MLSWKKKKTMKEKTSWQLQLSIWDQQDSLCCWEVLGGVCVGSQATNSHRLHHLESAEVVTKCWLGGCSNKEGGGKYITDFGFLQNPQELKYEQILWEFYHQQVLLDRHMCLTQSSMGVSPRLSESAPHWWKDLWCWRNCSYETLKGELSPPPYSRLILRNNGRTRSPASAN